jgi:hypothetical protein
VSVDVGAEAALPVPAPAAAIHLATEPPPAPPALAPPMVDPAAGAIGEAPPLPTPADAEPTTSLEAEATEEAAEAEAEREPEPEPPRRDPAPARDAPELASIGTETWVFAEPRWRSLRLGYLRAGAVVARKAKPAGTAGCEGGWYAIEPRGYVCVGRASSLDVFHPVAEAMAARPRREGLPYTYVMSRLPGPPVYARLPTDDEQRRVETDLASHLRKVGTIAKTDPSFVEPPAEEPFPSALLYGRPLPAFGNQLRSPDALVLERAKPRSGFALLTTFDHDGRRFGVTTGLGVVPLDRTRVVRESAFVGLALDDTVTLPVAFARSKRATRYAADERGALARGEPLAFREAVPLTGEERRVGGAAYLVAKDGSLVREDQVVRVDRFREAPAWAAGGRKWVDVSILHQSLVAYEGTRPVYVTLVSTGRDGLGDPKKTHSTVLGTFLIHTKHVSITMDGDDAGDEFDLRDVPFVQYFTEGFALHAAYWHDDFGTPRSHGCVNLAPKDAAWLFGWTTPDVPEAWHGALTLRHGTLVHTHP